MLSDSIAALRGVKSGLGHTVEGKGPLKSHSFVFVRSYLVSKKLEHIHYIHFYYHRFASTAAQLGEFAVEAKVNMYVGPFVGALGAGRYSVPPQNIKFQSVKVKASSGSFSPYMVAECKKIGMKPLCEHPSYCRNDKKALYMGQYYHLSHRPYRNINSWFPSGWSKIRSYFSGGLCFYSGNNRGNAYCNYPFNGHAWKYPKDVTGGSFMCGAVTKDKARGAAPSGDYNPGFVCARSKPVGVGSAHTGSKSASLEGEGAGPSFAYSLLRTHCTRAGIEWRR